jgi:hypothetical protein
LAGFFDRHFIMAAFLTDISGAVVFYQVCSHSLFFTWEWLSVRLSSDFVPLLKMKNKERNIFGMGSAYALLQFILT